MDDEFIDAIDNTADTSFSAEKTFGRNEIAERRSGSNRAGFLRPGERDKSYGPPFEVPSSEPPPKYFRIYCTPNDDEKRGAWQLQEEYFAGRLGKDEEENGRNWNTVTWIDKLLRITTMPAEALPPLNIYVGDKLSQSTEGTGAPTGPDDEAPDEAGNEGIEFENIYVDQADNDRVMCVMDDDGTTRRLDIKIDGYDLLRLIDEIEDIDALAKIDVKKLALTADPLPEQIDFPSPAERAHASKIVRMLMVGMRSLWHPVKRSIADHATMTSLGQGKGRGVAAAIGRQRVIEGLRIAESIRKGLTRQDRPFSMWQNQIRARQIPIRKPGLTAARREASVDEIIKAVLVATTPVISMPMIGDYEPTEILQDNVSDTPTRSSAMPAKSSPMSVRAPIGHYWNQATGPVIKLPDNPLPANDSFPFDAVAVAAA
jgi:hypothetical protein